MQITLQWILHSHMFARMTGTDRSYVKYLENKNKSGEVTYDIVQSLRSPGLSLQKSHTRLHSWDVWQSWVLLCNLLCTQRRWQEAHFALQSCTPAFKSTVALSNVLRSSSMLAWLVWKRERFKVIHSRTCSTRISTRLLRCAESFDAHSASTIS